MGKDSGLTEIALSILFFPTFFQEAFIQFAWAAEEEAWILILKRIFLLLPTLAIILGCWLSVVCLLTVIIRQKRREFVTLLFVTWWDLGKAIFSFWGGIFKFALYLVAALLGFIKTVLVGVWIFLHDLVMIPFRVVRIVGENVLRPGLPWIAVALTLIWCGVEAAVFTYVTSPLVIDTLGNLTGNQLSEGFIRIPLFFFMVFLVLGSYAVLATWSGVLKKKDVAGVLKIGFFELMTMGLEVLFLYREFVDALMPWFAQYSGSAVDLGMFGILAISSLVWLGIRGGTWFLFAAHGTPTIMAIIQGSGMRVQRPKDLPKGKDAFAFAGSFIASIKAEMDWVHRKGDDILGSFILPPLQVIAASINFCTLLVTTQHLFELPLRGHRDILDLRLRLRSVDLRGGTTTSKKTG